MAEVLSATESFTWRNKMRKRIVRFQVACVIGAVGWTALAAQAQDAVEAKSPIAIAVEALGSPDAEVRKKAATKLINERVELENCLTDQLNTQIRNPDTVDLRFDGPFFNLLRVLEEVRPERAAGPLVSLMDKPFIGTPPGDDFGGSEVYFPVAMILIKIGGPDLADSIFLRITRPVDEDFLRVSTFVLAGAYSKAVASFMIESHLATRTANAKANGDTTSDPGKQNLERMKQLLEGNQPLLPDIARERAAQRVKANATQPTIAAPAGAAK